MWNKKSISLLVMILVCVNVNARNFSGVKGNHSQYAAPFTSLSDNDVSGSAASGWYFKTANVTGGQGIKEAIVSASEKSSYSQTTDGNSFNYVTFTIVVYGKITQYGDSNGTTPTYSLKSRRDGELFIDSTEVVIPAGGNITFYGKEKFSHVADPTSAKKCDWALLPLTYKVAGKDYTPNPVYLVESTTCPISPSSNYKTPDPGLYTIKAKASPSSEMEWKTATLHVVEISKPVKNGSKSKWETGSDRYDCQVVELGTSGSYNLDIIGNWASRSDGQWSLSAAKGTIASVTSSSTTYSPPSASGSVDVRLKFTVTGNDILDSRTITIFEDHLARDYFNFGTNRSCDTDWKPEAKYGVATNDLPKTSAWNCHGSTLHAYNNSGTGWYQDDANFVQAAWGNAINTVTQTTRGETVSLGTLQRGDIIVYYDKDDTLMHSQTVTGGTTTYGANNQQLPSPGIPASQSWKWYTCTAGAWTKNIEASYLPITIEVYSP